MEVLNTYIVFDHTENIKIVLIAVNKQFVIICKIFEVSENLILFKMHLLK